MEKYANSQNEIMIRPVQAADLNRLKLLYREKHTGNDGICFSQSEKAAVISPDFGMPLAMAVSGKETIGYAYVKLDTNGHPVIGQLFRDSDDFGRIGWQLYEMARNHWQNLKNRYESDLTRLKEQIDRLTDWLQRCR